VKALVPKSNIVPLPVLEKGGSLIIQVVVVVVGSSTSNSGSSSSSSWPCLTIPLLLQGVLNVMVPQFVRILSKVRRAVAVIGGGGVSAVVV